MTAFAPSTPCMMEGRAAELFHERRVRCRKAIKKRAIGTATDAITNLTLPLDGGKQLVSHILIADALTRLFGAFGMIRFVSVIASKLLRIDLRKDGEALD